MLTNTPEGYILISERGYPMGVYRFMGGKQMADNVLVMEETECCPHCSGKHKSRDDKEFKDLMNRLKRIEGQVRGVEGMLENDAYCTDILIQVSAATAALNAFNKELLANHIKTCVTEHIKQGDESFVDELVQTIQKLMK